MLQRNLDVFAQVSMPIAVQASWYRIHQPNQTMPSDHEMDSMVTQLLVCIAMHDVAHMQMMMILLQLLYQVILWV
jgi:hypothetical protein